jgi:molybdenum cofactor guanylyltransferase
VPALSAGDAELAVASDGVHKQPVYALLPVCLAASLDDYLAGGERKVALWYARHRVAVAELSDRPESFININTLDDAAGLG